MSTLSLVTDDKRKDLRKESLTSVYSSNSRLNLLNKRKRMNALTVPVEMSNQSLNKSGDRYVTQRVLSAKTHRVKQLQNQLADAHFHLQELSNENKVLRAMQKKQEIALQRYENSNAELPQVLNSHTEEIRIQNSKFRQLKQQYKEVNQKLKEREMQLQQIRDEHQHLLDLSKDRNLLDREKLQAQVTDLSFKVTQQAETISTLQRRIALEAKNFKHQLQQEINKHKDTRHDLDLAINNADKLTTIIEMKEKLINNAATRTVKSPHKTSSGTNIPQKQILKTKSEPDANIRHREYDPSFLTKSCEYSRTVSSALSQDEDTSSIEPRSRYARSRTNSTSTRSTPNPGTRKNSKSSEEIIELAKTVQDGMADLAIFDDEIHPKTPDELQKKMESMKAELMKNITKSSDERKTSPDEILSRKTSALRKRSTEESIEEIEEERPKSRGRRNSGVTFFENSSIENSITTVAVHEEHVEMKLKREDSGIDKRLGKPIDKYCKEIIHDIEKSSKVIDRHMKQFNSSRFESEKLVEQLEAVDKINEFVNCNGEIPEATLNELNNNFKMLTDQYEQPVARKRSISGRRSSRESRSNLLGDGMTNQELLDDLLGKK